MKIGEKDIKWDMGWEAASELLAAINIVVTSPGINRVDGEGFSVYMVNDVCRVDMKREFYL